MNLKWVKKIDIQKEKVINSIGGLGFLPQDSRELINAPYIWPNYIGSNISVGVYDTGIWDQHPDFSGALIHSDIDSIGHGTHVSGIIASRGTRDIEGNYDAKGVAYGSKLYVINFSDANNDTSTAFSEFKNNSISIISNSWAICDLKNLAGDCIAYNFSYGPDAVIADSYVENNGTTVIFSAGNAGSDQETITNPGTAKNVITVGAISYTIGGYSGGVGKVGVGKVAKYSSRGPTLTSGRLKPDVVAPGGDLDDGYYKYGVVSTNAQNESGSWLDNSLDRWPTDSYYTRMAGTSMAAPHVTGTVALINQAYQNNNFSDGLQPRDYKALLIGDAIPLKGYGTYPRNGYANTNVGYGLIDAFFSIFDVTGEKQTLLWGHGEVIETIANTQDWNINIDGTEKKLAVVLAYEDDAGQIDDTHVLKDNLDLKIISPGGTEFNYTLPENVTAEEPEEKIVIDNPSDYGIGTWTIRVEGASWDSWFFDSKKYTVVVNAYYVEPSIVIEAPDVINVATGSNFTLSPTIRNTGGLTAAGVTVNVSTNGSGFGGDINNDTFVGNIVDKGNSKSASYNITAPLTAGDYYLDISADGINHDLNKPDNKIVKVSVISLSDWSNRKKLTINGTPAGAQTNYQMNLTVHKGSGKDKPGHVYLKNNVRDDFSDLRFTKSDGVTLLDYWIESYTSGVSATVWVEVDSIPASPNNTSIYLYYGNPSATSASSGTNTFTFFDHFNSISGTWTCGPASNQYGSGSCSASNSVATVTGGTSDWWSLFAGGAASFSPPLSVEFFSKDTVVYPGGFIIGMASSQSIVSPSYAAFFMGGPAVGGNGFSSSNNGTGSSEGSSNNLPSFSVVRIDVYDTKIDYYVNGSLVHTKTTNVPTGGMKVILSAAQPSSSVSTDWVFTRKFASPEPTWGT